MSIPHRARLPRHQQVDCRVRMRGTSRRAAPCTLAFGGALLAALNPLPSLAQSSSGSDALPTVVVTAARTEQNLADAQPSTRVFDRADIEQAQASDVAGLLRALTSVDVAQSGPLGSQTSLFLRGADSRQVLVLIDGVPMARADFGSAPWELLSIDQIERVEIVRGNMSALYGAQAVGGVVQIITRRAKAPEVSLSVGGQGTTRASVAGGHAWGEGATATSLAASLSHQRTDGYSSRDPAADPSANPDRDAGEQTGGSTRIEQGWGAGQRTSLSLTSTRTRSHYDGYTPGLDDLLSTRASTVGIQSRHALGSSVELGVDLGQTSEAYTDPTGYDTGGNSRTRIAGAQLGWAIAADQFVQVGAETKREHFESSTVAAQDRRTNAVRAGWTGRFGNEVAPGGARAWQAQLNVRNDRSSDYGSNTTGLAALAYEAVPGLKFGTQLSTAFSAPSFVDEIYADPATTLRAEHSRQAEVSVQWSSAGQLARLAWFEQHQRDRISFDPVTFQTVNIARARNRGVELTGESRLGPGTAGFDLTFQDPRDESTGQLLKRRARESAALNYRLDLSGWQTAAYLRHTGKRLDTDPVSFGDATNRARTTLDVTAQHPLGDRWRIAAKLENVANSHAPEVLGYTAAPRALLVTLLGTL